MEQRAWVNVVGRVKPRIIAGVKPGVGVTAANTGKLLHSNLGTTCSLTIFGKIKNSLHLTQPVHHKSADWAFFNLEYKLILTERDRKI